MNTARSFTSRNRAEVVRAARRHLRRADPVMRRMIDDVGEFTLRPQRDRFGMLVRSIISQQISTGAARSILARLNALAGEAGVTPRRLADLSPDDLRSAGVSPQKARYLHDLAAQVHSGTVKLASLGRRSDEDVIAELTQVKGIGRWTAQMFLIFSLGRTDVFPHDDLGVRTALRDNYGLGELPDLETSQRIAAPWRPFASVGSWYCWRALELARRPPDTT